MPKDEDVLQLVSVSMGIFFTHLIPPKKKHNKLTRTHHALHTWAHSFKIMPGLCWRRNILQRLFAELNLDSPRHCRRM